MATSTSDYSDDVFLSPGSSSIEQNTAKEISDVSVQYKRSHRSIKPVNYSEMEQEHTVMPRTVTRRKSVSKQIFNKIVDDQEPKVIYC